MRKLPAPDYIHGQPWPKIEAFYRDRVQSQQSQRPMLRLVEQVLASRFADGLYGATSHEDLLISQTTPFTLERELLRVTCDGQQMEFSFVEGPAVPPWKAMYPADQGFGAFEHFVVDLKHWFAPQYPLPNSLGGVD